MIALPFQQPLNRFVLLVALEEFPPGPQPERIQYIYYPGDADPDDGPTAHLDEWYILTWATRIRRSFVQPVRARFQRGARYGVENNSQETREISRQNSS